VLAAGVKGEAKVGVFLPKIVFCLCTLLVLAACGEKEGSRPPGEVPPRPVEVAHVEVRPLSETLHLVGSLVAAESTEILAEIDGRIEEIRFREGERVAAGQVLFRLDARELRAQLAEARARTELAKQDLERGRALKREGFISQAELDRLQADFDRGRADSERLAARLAKAEIRAPFAGVVGARAVSPGSVITTDTVLTRIDDTSRLKVEFMVPERFLPQVAIGTLVHLPDPALAEAAAPRGRVFFVSPYLDPQRRAGEVKALVENPSPQLRPGMFANVELVLRTVEAALTVPEGAVLSRADGHFLVAIRDREGQAVAEFLPVDLGIRRRGLVQVIPRDGEPAPGQPVVAAGVGALPLFPGAPLQPQPAGGKD
jgi:membrane fusion protein (multidrug efflux system)